MGLPCAHCCSLARCVSLWSCSFAKGLCESGKGGNDNPTWFLLYPPGTCAQPCSPWHLTHPQLAAHWASSVSHLTSLPFLTVYLHDSCEGFPTATHHPLYSAVHSPVPTWLGALPALRLPCPPWLLLFVSRPLLYPASSLLSPASPLLYSFLHSIFRAPCVLRLNPSSACLHFSF